MVRIEYPPENFPILLKGNETFTAKPNVYHLNEKQNLLRLYKSKPDRTGTTFRYDTKPSQRFDHHIPDAVRGTHYSAFDLSCCIFECFGSRDDLLPRSIDLSIYSCAKLSLKESLLLIDLRDDGALKIGTVTAISATEDRNKSQSWSRVIYDAFEYAFGLIYSSAHNQKDCIMFYERADNNVLEEIESNLLEDLRQEVLEIAVSCHFVVLPKIEFL